MAHKCSWADLRTCISPEGRFVIGLHEPHFHTLNLRSEAFIQPLGEDESGQAVFNKTNFPPNDIKETAAEPIFEVANPFPFRGTTFIGKSWADRKALDVSQIGLAPPQKVSLNHTLKKIIGEDNTAVEKIIGHLPEPLKLAVATTSTDPEELRLLARSCCRMRFDEKGNPTGLVHEENVSGHMRPYIFNHRLYEAVANNPFLEDRYKEVMVLRPGIQGDNEIVGQYRRRQSHVFEYLRRNSYIPWGHYASNMAHDAIRYAVGNLSPDDIFGLRHLYYQRTYARLAADLGITVPGHKMIPLDLLEDLRRAVAGKVNNKSRLPFSATLWGWNYGFDYAPSGYRLHASHQQVHQQYALIPDEVPLADPAGGTMAAFACGDMIQAFVQKFKVCTGRPFFHCYEQAIRANQRMDGRSSLPSNLIVHEDEQIMLFVPKAQTSQWELQLMPRHSVGNILEAAGAMRQSLDIALLTAMRILSALGATMITVIEYSKRFHIEDDDQRLLYSFLPRLPESPGAFSEAQQRWINGHYPEDFAAACRMRLEDAATCAAAPI